MCNDTLILEPHFSVWISKISWDTEGFLLVQNCCGNDPSCGPWVQSHEITICPAIWMAVMLNSCYQNKLSNLDKRCWSQFWRNSSASQTDFPLSSVEFCRWGAWWGAGRADVLLGGGSLLLAWDFPFLQKEGVSIWYHLSLSTDRLQCPPRKITAITEDIIFI